MTRDVAGQYMTSFLNNIHLGKLEFSFDEGDLTVFIFHSGYNDVLWIFGFADALKMESSAELTTILDNTVTIKFTNNQDFKIYLYRVDGCREAEKAGEEVQSKGTSEPDKK